MDIQAIIFNFSKAPDAAEREILCALRRRGYRLAANFACGYCDASFEIEEGKGREALLAAAQALGVEPTECAVVESECDGLRTAKESGMTAIGIGKAALCVYADVCLRKLAELTDIFV